MSSKAKIGIGVAVVAVLIAVFATQGELLTGKITLSSCPGPYHVLTSDKHCVWSCGVGTTPGNPNNRRGQCVCKSGYTKTGKDSFGRRVCSPSTTPPPPPPAEPPPPPPAPSTGEMSSAHLSVEHDIVADVRAGQIVAGNTNVVFGAFRFSADSESIRIRSIRLRNIGTNRDGLFGIRFTNADGSGFGDVSWPALTPEGTVLFDYSGPGPIITAGTVTSLTLKANTVHAATSGSTVEFIIEGIEGEGADSGLPVAASNISLTSTPTNLKVLYPTKLNFVWVVPVPTTLLTGSQVEVGRFTLGADVSNINNPVPSVAVTALNLTDLSTATLTNFTLNDVILTQGANVASSAASSSFSSSTAGGALSTLTLQQGETRTFKILADVETTAGYQTAQFRFNAGTESTPGSATWSVTNNGATSNSTWTVLAGGVDGFNSTTLVSASTPTRSP